MIPRARLASRPLASAACALAALGCADNAVFDLEITVPATGVYHLAIVDARPGSTSAFDDDVPWGADGSAREITLSDAAPTTLRVSIAAEHLEEDALVRIQFCENRECAGSTSVACFRFERPFHTGCASRYRGSITELVPLPMDANCSTPVRVVAECAVGCADGNWVEDGMFCDMDGAHGSDR